MQKNPWQRRTKLATNPRLLQNFGMTNSVPDLLTYTAEIVSAYLSNNKVPATELPQVISALHSSLGGLGGARP